MIVPAQPPSGMSGKSGSVVPGFTRTGVPTENLAGAGVLIGAAVALLLARILSAFSRLLYGVRANDPVTFMAVSLVLLGVSVLACYLPARRASRVDPMAALRYE